MSSTPHHSVFSQSRLTRLGAYAASTGATLGLATGIVELSLGPHIRAWVGNKQDTTRLGLATITLSLIALAAAAAWLRQRQSTTAIRLLVIAGLLVPGLICFTTVGRLWYLPGTLLLIASCAALVALRHAATDVRATISRTWFAALTAVLAGFYVFLGATALGLAGVLGVLGGIAILVALARSAHMPKWLRPIVLFAAATPFAALTWWSVITPLVAVLILAIGWPALNRHPDTPERAAPRAGSPGDGDQTQRPAHAA